MSQIGSNAVYILFVAENIMPVSIVSSVSSVSTVSTVSTDVVYILFVAENIMPVSNKYVQSTKILLLPFKMRNNYGANQSFIVSILR